MLEYSTIKESGVTDKDTIAKIDDNNETDSIFEVIKDLCCTATKINNFDYNTPLFDFSYEAEYQDQILSPLDPLSFYKDNHIYNKAIISQLDKIDIQLAR
jgi:hypothetical protein